MHRYFIKTPWLARKVFPDYLWRLPADENEVYLSFDDGPHPGITPWVLDRLKEADARATFFCIGKHVEAYPEIYQRILSEGHAVGNHTQDHLNGWKTESETYLQNIKLAARCINSTYFRPPYGRIRSTQAKRISESMGDGSRIIMWDVLSGDFDSGFSGEDCYRNVVRNSEPGSIIVFHDSEKAFENLKVALPKVLKHFRESGWRMKKLEV